MGVLISAEMQTAYSTVSAEWVSHKIESRGEAPLQEI